ncbi:MAG TPA: helix-turn-helix transcriptional regulator [Clostridia bacterium]
MIKELLVKKGLSQSKAARLADIPQSSFCLIANGKGYCPPAWKKRIAKVLEVSESELFAEKEAN